MAKKETSRPLGKEQGAKTPTTHKRSDVGGTQGTNKPGGRPSKGNSGDKNSE